MFGFERKLFLAWFGGFFGSLLLVLVSFVWILPTCMLISFIYLCFLRSSKHIQGRHGSQIERWQHLGSSGGAKVFGT